MLPNDPLHLANEALKKAIETEKRNKSLIASLGPAIVGVLKPVLDEILSTFQKTSAEMKQSISDIKIDKPEIPTINVPELKWPELHIPTPQVTVNVPDIKMPPFPEVKLPKIVVPEPKVTVNIPPFNIPELRMPEEMQTRGFLNLIGWDKSFMENPLPVQLRDASGNPVNLFDNLTQISGGGGSRRVKIDNTANEPIPVSGTISATFSADFGAGQSGSQTLRTIAATDSVQSVYIVGANATVGVVTIDPDGNPKYTSSGGGSGTEYTEDTSHSGGTVTGPVVMGVRSSTATSLVSDDEDYTPAIFDANGNLWTSMGTRLDTANDSVNAVQVSGSIYSVAVIDVFGSTAATSVFNADNRIRVSVETGGSGITDSEIRASSLPVAQASGAVWSVWAQDALTTSSSTSLVNGDNRIRVAVDTGTSGLTDAELRASAVPVSQVSGVAWSVFAQDALTTTSSTTLVNSDNRIRVSLETGGSGLTDSELRASSVPVSQVSGSIDSVYITGAAASTFAEIMNPDGRVKVELPSGASGLTDTELRASHLDVQQVSGAVDSVYVLNPVDNGDSATALRVVIAGNSSASVAATQSGTWNIGTVTTVTGVTNSVAVVALDRDGNPLTTGPIGQGDDTTALRVVHAGNAALSVTATQTGTWNIGTVTTVTGITNTVATNIVDSTGIAYSGSNPLPITLVSGGITSTIAVGSVVGDAIDDGSAPIQTGGIARTANPTAVSGGDVVKSSYDVVGRQLIRPVQVRGLIVTAYATLTNGTETTLLSGSAGFYHDIVYITAANNSDAAVAVDFRGVTGGNISQTIVVPPYGTAGVSSSVPYPQSDTGNSWTADMGDITGTTVYLTGLFSREV